VQNDLKLIMQSLRFVANYVQFTKFLVFLKLEDDPELFEIIADGVKANVSKLTTEDMATVLVNLSHSLSPETGSVFEVVNGELVYRLDSNYDPENRALYLQHEDIPKLLHLLLDFRQMSAELKESLLDRIQEEKH